MVTTCPHGGYKRRGRLSHLASCSLAPPRCPASESISSMKIVEGAWKRAISKSNRTWCNGTRWSLHGGRYMVVTRWWWLQGGYTARTIFSESPLHLEARVDEVSEKKEVPHSVATALASSVFPVPGGPNMSTPFHGLRIPLK